jgi:flagellin-like protein
MFDRATSLITNDTKNEEGVSGVIGVILMVAITVILASVIGVFVFGFAGDTDEPVNAGVTIQENSEGVEVRWYSGGNAEYLEVSVDGNTVEGSRLENVGDRVVIQTPEDTSVNIIGTTGEGDKTSSSVVQSETTTQDTTGGTGTVEVVSGGSNSGDGTTTQQVSGTVSINPTLDGVTVTSVGEDGSEIDSTTTSDGGNYTVDATENSSIVVNVGGVDYNGTPLYAGYEKSVTSVDQDVNFDFDETQVKDATVNGEQVQVVYTLNSTSEKQITNVYQLQALDELNVSNKYTLVQDIDASGTQTWNESSSFTDSVGGTYYSWSSGDTIELSRTPVGSITSITDDNGSVSATVTNSSEGVITLDESAEGALTVEYTTAQPVAVGFEPLFSSSAYEGTLNGNNHSITGLEINKKYSVDSETDAGLFHETSGATIQNLSIDGSVTADQAGMLTATSTNDTITNVSVSGTVTGEENVGGLIGQSGDTTVDNATVNTDVEADIGAPISVGGIIGNATDAPVTITNSTYGGDILVDSSLTYGGMLVGQGSSLSVADSEAKGTLTVTGSASNVGGAVGYAYIGNSTPEASNVTVSGDIIIAEATDYVGGFMGYGGANISNSKVTGSFTLENPESSATYGLGGFMGGSYAFSETTISDSSTSISVTSSGNSTGGFIGSVENGGKLTISNSSATGDVSSTANYDVGGFIGGSFASAEIVVEDSYATGTVSGEGNNVGGFVGRISSGSMDIDNSYATGNVSSTGQYNTGGFIGSSFTSGTVTIDNAYSTGAVDGGANNSAGFVGFSNSGSFQVTNAYHAGTATASGSVSGFSNLSETQTTNTYYDNSKVSSSDVTAAGLTTSEMQGTSAESNMTGFDFTSIWTTVDNDYPDLQ